MVMICYNNINAVSYTHLDVYKRQIFDNGRYTGVAKALLSASVESSVDANTKTIVRDSTKGKVITYRNGVEFDPAQQMILPGLFLVLFYLLIAFFGNQMLTSTTEEKENRVIEMLLTTCLLYTSRCV